MTLPSHRDDLADPLTTDEEVLARVEALVGVAFRRQLWFLFLDEDGCQLPLIIPMEIGERPARRDRASMVPLVEGAAHAAEASELVIVYERPGARALRPDDRRWIQLVVESCRDAGLPLRGPLLSHAGGVRWIAPDDYAR
ncbi:hypothetical protein [Homoserinibacter sp. YIM 151385]|uniref:hypothetical protein n=1 Tax=Homoserinibacter sp. YIM 151385 TaxID=2985506 RepID=UPI0022F0CE76|nr:hypothetical protein [Homoserinibacter sp. YIM 151385]WBU38373.1 hypothetical protein OF852_01960 [Homoserinibacter sp. YIM 151385]